MSAPKPPVSLDGACSVINNGTLYVYTPSAFVSLDLEKNGKWKKLSSGVSVSGAACTTGNVDGDPDRQALYVVGGTTSTKDYKGLQRYSFTDQKWETMRPQTWNLASRVHHAVAYVESPASLVVYAGSQSGSKAPSTETYVISAAPPYTVKQVKGAPGATDPTLLSWASNAAAAVGGMHGDLRVWTITDGTWKPSGASLTKELPPKSQAQSAMLVGSDQSKTLEVFDASTSPNTVTRYLLYTNAATAAAPGKEIGTKSSHSRRHAHAHRDGALRLSPGVSPHHRRDITVDSYPSYNDKYAPKQTRKDWSLAQDGSKMVAIVGGSSENPVALFDQSKNSWPNPQEVFGSSHSHSTQSSTSTSSTSSATPSTSPTISQSPTHSTSSTSQPAPVTISKGVIIGASVGAGLGLLAIIACIIALIIIIKRQRSRKAASAANRRPDAADKDRLSFQDQGMVPLSGAAQPMGHSPVAGGSPGAGTEKAAKIGSAAAMSNISANAGDDKGHSRDSSSIMSPPGSLEKHFDASPLAGGSSGGFGWGKYFGSDAAAYDLAGDSRATARRSSNYPLGSSHPLDGPPSRRHIISQGPLGEVSCGSPLTEHPPAGFGFGGDNPHPGFRAHIAHADSASFDDDASDFEDERYDSLQPPPPGVSQPVIEPPVRTFNRSPATPRPEDQRQRQHSALQLHIPQGRDNHGPIESWMMSPRPPSVAYTASFYGDRPPTGMYGNATETRLSAWPGAGSRYMETPPPAERGISTDMTWIKLGDNQ